MLRENITLICCLVRSTTKPCQFSRGNNLRVPFACSFETVFVIIIEKGGIGSDSNVSSKKWIEQKRWVARVENQTAFILLTIKYSPCFDDSNVGARDKVDSEGSILFDGTRILPLLGFGIGFVVSIVVGINVTTWTGERVGLFVIVGKIDLGKCDG